MNGDDEGDIRPDDEPTYSAIDESLFDRGLRQRTERQMEEFQREIAWNRFVSHLVGYVGLIIVVLLAVAIIAIILLNH